MNSLTACALVALQFAAPAVAAAQEMTPAGSEGVEGDMIIVTGTRDARRTQFDTLAPIDVLSGKAIDNSVSNDLSDTLAQLLPSFNVQRLPAADGQAFVRPATLRGLSPDQTLVLVNGKRYHRSALLGTRGAAGDAFTYDLSAALGRSRINYNMSESLNASLGPDSPTSFYLGRLMQREFNLNADFVYRLPLGMAEPANIAFGAERRKETYAIRPGDPASYAIGPGAATGLAPNSNGFPGFSPLSAGEWSQTSYAGYVDVEVRPVEMLTLGAAGRYEDFSAFGDTFNYKLSARLEPVSGVALRATYSTGFRAPTPAQLNALTTSQGLDTRTLQIFNTGRLSPSDPIAVALGAKPLTPEKSRTLTAGLTFQSDFGLTGSIDVYQIKLRDRFGQSATFAVPANLPNPQRFTAVTYFTNDFDTRTRGVDVVLAYARDVGPGKADISLAYNYNQTRVTSGTSASIGNETQRVLFEDRLPKHNGTASLGYTIGRFGLQGRARYYGAWTDVSGNATGEVFQRFGSMVMFDLSASLQLNDHLSIRAGAENIFDTYPDEATNQAVRGLIYSRNAPYDTDGGQYYVRLGITF